MTKVKKQDEEGEAAAPPEDKEEGGDEGGECMYCEFFTCDKNYFDVYYRLYCLVR